MGFRFFHFQQRAGKDLSIYLEDRDIIYYHSVICSGRGALDQIDLFSFHDHDHY